MATTPSSGWNPGPPRGGPIVKTKGFAGPLYPPDSPKGPSKDSPLVVCMKRWAARCGAWPWDPDGWDDSYSNAFAHGHGWNDPTHAGIAGLQHWSGTIDPTGNVGEKTFNFARSVKVPQGRTHAGEMAFDSVCVQLANQAYDAAHPPKPQTTIREAALRRAITQIGQTESPAESNMTPYGSWFGMNGVPWCSIFATWSYENGAKDLGKEAKSFMTVKQSSGQTSRWSYVPYLVSDARGGRYGLSVASSPTPGDLVAYAWGSSGSSSEEFDHVGIFEEWLDEPGVFNAIEGNTSTSNDSNGGAVMRRQRSTMGQGTVFVRVAE
jgi:hypothetical protein